MHVVLRSIAAGRSLYFTKMDAITPVNGVILASPDGYEIARAAPDSASLVVPSWVQNDEPLLVTSPTTFPGVLRLSQVAGDAVALPGRRSATITCEDVTGCSQGATLVLGVEEAPLGTELEPSLARHQIALTAGSPVTLELPSERKIWLRAHNSCGAFDEAEVAANERDVRATLALRSAEHQLVRVVDLGGSPITAARAATSSGVFAADATGHIRLPLALDIGSFEVAAPGYSPVAVSRNRALSMTGAAEALHVVLVESIDTTFSVRSRSGRPLPGMSVRIWPESPRGALAPISEPGMIGATRRSLAGTTNSAGDFVARGLAAGPAEVEVALAPELATDPYLRSAYPIVASRHVLTDGGRVTLEAPEPLNVSLEVIDGTTGEPVRAFELRTHDPAAPPVAVRGAYWQGWISSDLEQLTAAVEGLGTEAFLPRRTPDGSPQRVVVGHRQQVELVFRDLPVAARGVDLSIGVMSSKANGLHGLHGLHGERSAVVRADESGRALLDLGDATDLWIKIAPIELGGRRLRFEPELLAVGSEGSLIVRCVVE
ncbi:MAG: hypothetical protein WD226_08240 [Planctomycetota bacterium]